MRDRTADLLNANQALSQLSYSPVIMVGLGRFELPTSPLSGVRSNQLSYRPMSQHPTAISAQRQSRINQTKRRQMCGHLLSSARSFKEVIQPQVPLGLPCYDFTPVTVHSFGGSFLAVRSPTSGANDSHGVTGGVYKTRERIHRGKLIRDY